MTELVQWQQYSPVNGMIQCWFTHPCLEWMERQDWKDKVIIMLGAGLGDAWLANKCKHLFIVERNPEWLLKSKEVSEEKNITNITYLLRECNDGNGEQEKYVFLPDVPIDIIVNDDAYRTEICQMAVDYFNSKDNGGILICDNWIQSFVWMSPKAEEIMQPYKSLIFEQKDHTDNDGINKWKTAAFFINTK